jgi:murein DD-endopeptidase MepM/ murein hydrolase activator NlpD
MAGARFSPEQLQIARGLLSAPQYRGAGPKVKLAEAETGIVESNLSNPGLDKEGSAGPLQQTPKNGWGSVAQVRNARYASEQFLKRAIPLAGKYGSAGQLAQAVQRSAYPERYDQHAAEAAQLLAMLGGNSGPHRALSALGAGAPPVQAEAVQPVGPSAAQSADLTQLLQSLVKPSQSSSLAETQLVRPSTSGGPESPAGTPRVPSPLTTAAAPASGLDAQLALVQKISEDAAPEAAATEAAPANGISPASETNRGISRAGPGKLGGFLPGNAQLKMGRIDQGQDGSTNPGGPILAPGAGVVEAVKSDPNGFGPSYPVVRFTSGPLAGKSVYIGHTLAAVKAGQKFQAGQVLSHTGVNGYGNAAGKPGWFEIGLASALGQGIHNQGAQIAPYLR